jgi:hypothetical protein
MVLINGLSQVIKCKEVLDNTITLTKSTMSGALIDMDRVVLGTEEGLLCVDLDREGKQLNSCCSSSNTDYRLFDRNRSSWREQAHLSDRIRDGGAVVGRHLW